MNRCHLLLTLGVSHRPVKAQALEARPALIGGVVMPSAHFYVRNQLIVAPPEYLKPARIRR